MRSFIAIAALFSEWSVQSVNNPNKPEADLSSRSNYLFSTEVCQHRYGEVPIASNFAPYHPLDCNTYSSWSAYFKCVSLWAVVKRHLNTHPFFPLLPLQHPVQHWRVQLQRVCQGGTAERDHGVCRLCRHCDGAERL